MQIMHERVAGLDVHKDSVVACVRWMSGGKTMRECRTFETTTDGLLSLLEWLVSSRCEVVAMEATGVYWIPVWKILSDGQFTLIVANAAHIKAVPGRKTDVNDAAWIADLAAFGLLKASFVPEEDLYELRGLMRTRKQLVREQSSHIQRIQKTLTEANIRADRGRAQSAQACRLDRPTAEGHAERTLRRPARRSPIIIASCCSSICGNTTRWTKRSGKSIARRRPVSRALTNGSSPSPGFVT